MSDGLVLAVRIASVAVGFPLLAWVFGSAVLGRFTRLDREERFAASFGVGFAAEGLCAFLAFVLHAPQPFFNAGAVLLMLGTALLCHLTTPRRAAEGPSPWPLAAVFVLAYLHLVCLQALLPAYRGSYWYFDWWMHYDEALVFVGREPVETVWAKAYTLASRTPLFNLTTAFVMGLDGSRFATYQLASALTNIAFVLGLYLLLRDLFGRRAAWLALLLAPLNLWMLHNAWFTWPKMLAAYYLFLALHFYLQSVRRRGTDPARASEYFVCFGIASLLGYMAHQVALVYVAPLLLHAAVMGLRGRALRPGLRELLACGLLGVAVGGTWYAWLAGTLGTDKILHSTPVTRGDESAQFRPKAIAKWMGYNLLVSVAPAGIAEAFLTGLPPNAEAPPRSVEVYRGSWFELTESSLDSLGEAEIPAAVREKLKPLQDKEFDTRESFLGAVAGVLDGGELERWQDVLLSEAHHERRWFVGPPDLVELHRGVTQLYFSLFSGALTVSLGVFLLAAVVRRLRHGPDLPATKEPSNGPAVWSAVWLCLLGGTLGGALLHPGKIPWGIAHSAVFPTAVVLAALAWGLLSRARPTVAALVCCGMVLEFLLMFWSHWWLLCHDPEILEPGAGKAGPRDTWVPLLNEALGRGDRAFLVGAVVVQLTLIVLLLLAVRRPPQAAPEVRR
ncbi:MAG TPA: glycosyltransferase family 39 protein [Gemmataceae bacterium]|nr:glycosyltransferase family 39 protein [Gemmataceae bacterium]